MKKKLIFGLLMAIAVSGAAFVGCDLFSAGGSDETYEPLIIRGITLSGDDVEIEISTKRTVPRVVLTPTTNDSYVLRVMRVETSRGTIEVSETTITFYPNNGAQPFTVRYIKGEYITLYEIPAEDGTLTTGLTPSNPGSSAPRPGSITIKTADELINLFGARNVTKNPDGSATIKGNIQSTDDAEIEVPMYIDSDNNAPVSLTIAPNKVVKLKKTTGSGKDLTVRNGTEFIISGGGTFMVDDAEVAVTDQSKMTVDADSTLEIINGSSMIVQGGDIDIWNLVTVSSTSLLTSSTIGVYTGNINVHFGGELRVAANGKLDLEATDLRVRAVGDSNLKIVAGGIVDVGAGTWNGDFNKVTITGGTLIVPFGTNGNSSTQIINAIRAISGAGNAEELVIQLTPAFYSAVNTDNYFFWGSQANNTDVPYTVRGLAGEKIKTGMFLVDTNMTLQGVDFDIDVDKTTKVYRWGFGSNYYGVAISLCGYNGSAYVPSEDITIKDCNITIRGGAGAAFTAGIFTYSEIKNIRVLNKISDVTGVNSNAVQALFIDEWGPGIEIISNTLTARYGGATPTTPAGAPASAIFINWLYGAGNQSFSIFDNSLSYRSNSTEGSAYSFYVNNILSNDWNVYPYGVQDLFSKGFATENTEWALANDPSTTSTIYRKVFDALIAECKSPKNGGGFGAFCIPIMNDLSDFVHEIYNIVGNRLTTISIGSYPLNGTESAYDRTKPVIYRGFPVTSSNTLGAGQDGYYLKVWTNSLPY